MPPAPMAAPTSYGPSLSPGLRGIESRGHYSVAAMETSAPNRADHELRTASALHVPRIDDGHIQALEVGDVAGGEHRPARLRDAGDHRVAQVRHAPGAAALRREQRRSGGGGRVEIQHAIRQLLLEYLFEGP